MDPTIAGGIDADIAEDFALLGAEIHPDEITTDEEDVLGIWQQNWPSFQAFLGCQTQWRGGPSLSGMIWTGLDYPGVEVVMRRQKSPDHVFDDLQHMEREALRAFGEVKQ